MNYYIKNNFIKIKLLRNVFRKPVIIVNRESKILSNVCLCIYFYMSGYSLCMSVYLMLGAHEEQKRILAHLESELNIVLSHHVGAQKLTQILYKSNKCFNYCNVSSALRIKIVC